MPAPETLTCNNPGPIKRLRPLVPGLTLVFVIALLAGLLAASPWLEPIGLGGLTLAVLVGLFVGNLLPERLPRAALVPGLNLCKGPVLRTGIILFGFHTSLQAMASIGLAGLGAAVFMLTSTLAVTLLLTRGLRLPGQTGLLMACGSAICGAAAILAVSQTMRARESDTLAAIASVVLFGTLGMFFYPVLYPLLGLTETAYGIWVGSSLHEVAQVVVAGSAVSPVAAETSVVVKMSRVLMLVPVLVLLSGYAGQRRQRATQTGHSPGLALPWFALGFVLVVLLNSLVSLPAAALQTLQAASQVLMILAMAALGLSTRLHDLRLAGPRVLLAGALVFIFLMTAGLVVPLWLASR